MEKIDFVILWVDGSDEKWLKEKNKYTNIKGDASINRFRDFGNLQYLFRGIEKYADFVNNIFFITWGHIPSWLNVNHPKLKIIRHDQFIPNKYLPTFNSNVIELNLHRIKDLSEHFVLFNDDLFILNDLFSNDFFENGLPKDMYVEYFKKNCSRRHSTLRKNYQSIISKYFDKKTTIKNNINKVFNLRYGLLNFKTLSVLKYKQYCDFYSDHLNRNFLKSYYEKLWKLEYDILDKACYNKFRADSDIGQAIVRYFSLLEGNFAPYKSLGKYFIIKNDNTKLIKCISKKKYKIICINDADTSIDFEKTKKEINEVFEKKFPNKSKFEL